MNGFGLTRVVTDCGSPTSTRRAEPHPAPARFIYWESTAERKIFPNNTIKLCQRLLTIYFTPCKIEGKAYYAFGFALKAWREQPNARRGRDLAQTRAQQAAEAWPNAVAHGFLLPQAFVHRFWTGPVQMIRNSFYADKTLRSKQPDMTRPAAFLHLVFTQRKDNPQPFGVWAEALLLDSLELVFLPTYDMKREAIPGLVKAVSETLSLL